MLGYREMSPLPRHLVEERYRAGQASFELGDMEGARRNLTSAYLGGGEAMFAGEDPKYLALAK